MQKLSRRRNTLDLQAGLEFLGPTGQLRRLIGVDHAESGATQARLGEGPVERRIAPRGAVDPDDDRSQFVSPSSFTRSVRNTD